MEKRLKERLIGAVVLVGLGILIIPALLDGPDRRMETREIPLGKGPETRRVEIELGKPEATQAQAPAETAPQTPAPAPSPEPQPRPEATTAAPRSASADTGAGADEDSRAKAAQAATQSGATGSSEQQPAAAKPAEGWAVQVGSFSQEGNAERMAAELEKTGFQAFVTRLEQSGRVLYRVRVGPVASRQEAEQLAQRLRGAGRRAQVMPHP